MEEIAIIGGGLAGLINAIRLSKAGFKVVLIEKKAYPFHRVCGEYISNEVLPFLNSIGIDIDSLKPARISRLKVTSPLGAELSIKLDMGGFGISRYTLDHYLYTVAEKHGVQFFTNTQVLDVQYSENCYHLSLSEGQKIQSKLVIGSFGKRSLLDRQMNRSFFYKRSPYIGVKYHIRTDSPSDLISLHNFKDGYCGMSMIEDQKFCLCYLTTRENLKKHGSIQSLEENILYRNKNLKQIFSNAEFLYDKPEVINEISFVNKSCVDERVLMSGDAAGMITPLCGNGMAMAIHSAKILSDLIIKYYNKGGVNYEMLEQEYSKAWKREFASRLAVGRQIQNLFGKEWVTELALLTLSKSAIMSKWLIKKTHGKVF